MNFNHSMPRRRRRSRRPGGTPPENRIYIVRRGDTLWSISQRFGVNADNIMFINKLTHTILIPGQRLIIPVSITAL